MKRKKSGYRDCPSTGQTFKDDSALHHHVLGQCRLFGELNKEDISRGKGWRTEIEAFYSKEILNFFLGKEGNWWRNKERYKFFPRWHLIEFDPLFPPTFFPISRTFYSLLSIIRWRFDFLCSLHFSQHFFLLNPNEWISNCEMQFECSRISRGEGGNFSELQSKSNDQEISWMSNGIEKSQWLTILNEILEMKWNGKFELGGKKMKKGYWMEITKKWNLMERICWRKRMDWNRHFLSSYIQELGSPLKFLHVCSWRSRLHLFNLFIGNTLLSGTLLFLTRSAFTTNTTKGDKAR